VNPLHAPQDEEQLHPPHDPKTSHEKQRDTENAEQHKGQVLFPQKMRRQDNAAKHGDGKSDMHVVSDSSIQPADDPDNMWMQSNSRQSLWLCNLTVLMAKHLDLCQPFHALHRIDVSLLPNSIVRVPPETIELKIS
jgi:hypothetical protein